MAYNIKKHKQAKYEGIKKQSGCISHSCYQDRVT